MKMRKKNKQENKESHDQFHYIPVSQKIMLSFSWNPNSMFGFEEVSGFTFNYKAGNYNEE